MKYILIVFFLVQVGFAGAMDNESKAKKLKALKAMGADNKAANRNMSALPPEDTVDEERRLLLERIESKFKKLDAEHRESLEQIQRHGEQQIERLSMVVDRQTNTISYLNELIKKILKMGYANNNLVKEHDQEIAKMREVVDTNVDGLLDAVGDQTDIINRQNKAIKELLNRLDSQNKILKEQSGTLARHGRLLARTRTMISGLTAVCDTREIDSLIAFCEKELQKEDLPVVVATDTSDDSLYEKVFGSSSGGDFLRASATSDEVEACRLRIENPKFGGDATPPDSPVHPNSPARTSDGYEVVEEYVEDIEQAHESGD